jgi:Leucine-rich repeat (LRR) protein
MAIFPCPHCQIPLFPSEFAAGVCPVCQHSLKRDAAPPDAPENPPIPNTPSRKRFGLWPSSAGVCVLVLAAAAFWPRQSADTPIPPEPEPVVVNVPLTSGTAVAVVAKVEPGLAREGGQAILVFRAEDKPRPEEEKVAAVPPRDAGPDRQGSKTGPRRLEADWGKPDAKGKDLDKKKGIPDPRTVNLRGMEVDGAQLEQLGEVNNLDLSETSITDLSLAHLSQLTELRKLDLSGTQVAGPGLAPLSWLTSLNLSRTSMTDPGMEYLGRLRALRELQLQGTHVHGPGLEYLIGLTRLDLSDCPVADKGLKSLYRLKQLRWLNLAGTRVTDEGVEALRDKLPNLEIIR